MTGVISQYYSSVDYTLSLPLVLLTVFALGILIIDLFLPREMKYWNAVMAEVGLAFSAAALLWKIHLPSGGAPPPGFRNAWMMDSFAIFFFYLVLVAAAIAIFMSVRYLETEKEHHGEFYALILFSVVGMMCLAAGMDVVLLFIGLELMAISTYVLVGFLRSDRRSNEAALKYLILGAFSSGIFAYGLSLLYGLSGSTNLVEIAAALEKHLEQLRAGGSSTGPVVVLALVTTLTGLLFKVAAIPFHQWAPDAYEGAPHPVTGFMSVAVKAAAWALLLRMVLVALPPLRDQYLPLIIFVAVATLTGGNLAAITQTNLKRLFAYSSIAHVGYMLLGVVAGNQTGIEGILVYLLVYTFMNLGVFVVITSLRRQDVIGDELDDITGLYFKAPTSAVAMLIFLLSLAGIPPLAGFYGKYFIFLALIETGHYVLAGLAVLYVAVSLYYYLRIANAMFMKEALDTVPVRLSPGLGFALAVTAFATVALGLYPDPFIRAAQWGIQFGQPAGPVAQLLP